MALDCGSSQGGSSPPGGTSSLKRRLDVDTVKKKYIVTYDAGYGPEHEIIEAKDDEAANEAAYECWREAAENNAQFGAEEYTEERAKDLGLED
jgi:hypothetical protein